MVIQNIETKKQYTMPRASWDALGKNQKLFKVIDERDEEEIKPQIIDNMAKPGTGSAVITNEEEKTNTKKTKKKN